MRAFGSLSVLFFLYSHFFYFAWWHLQEMNSGIAIAGGILASPAPVARQVQIALCKLILVACYAFWSIGSGLFC